MKISEIFNENSTSELAESLEEFGYVIDGINNTFSSTQLEFMNQEIFDELCEKYNIHHDFTISTIGGYSDTEGALYMVYNSDDISFEKARNILNISLQKSYNSSLWKMYNIMYKWKQINA